MKKIRIKQLLFALIASLCFVPDSHLIAQNFTTLHSFTNGSDGPLAGIISSSNMLYGTTFQGGSSDEGTIFKMNTDGTEFTNLYVFTPFPNGTNTFGARPSSELVLLGNRLYGTAQRGGDGGQGTVFALNTDGTDLVVLHSFTPTVGSFPVTPTNSDGAMPYGGLILSGTTLYGTAHRGGSLGAGTVFALNTDGTNFRTLHSLNGASDGALPTASLVLAGDTLYGTAKNGGIPGGPGDGTVFSIRTNGTQFTILHSFSSAENEGASPYAALVVSGNRLYGTTFDGGISSSAGTVFGLNTDGTGFKTLYDFTFTNPNNGCRPYAGLALSGNILYGTTETGGFSNEGTLFAVNTDGTGFNVIHSFTATGGSHPVAGLILLGNTLYGTTEYGGSLDYGAVFGVSLPPEVPQLTINLSAADIVLTWPTNAIGFMLQSTADLVSPVWTTNFPPVVVNGQNTVTNPIASAQRFFRLSQ